MKEVDAIKRLERVFKLKNFVQAMEFTNKIGAIAEAEDHHPLIILEVGRVTAQGVTAREYGMNLSYMAGTPKNG